MPPETTHLRLRAFSGDDLLALLAGVAEGERQIGLPLADGIRDFYVSGEVSAAWLELLRRARGVDPWVHGFGLVEKQSGKVIGTAGFKGPPDDRGAVEIAYAIVPDYCGRGYATEAAAALVAFAFADSQVRLVRAHTLPTANASTRVLTKCGFAHLGQVIDPDDGPVWRWETTKPPALVAPPADV
jgi:ribosomal-protein-alanine N-acetyltransferase